MVVDNNGHHILRMITVWLNDPVILMMISVKVLRKFTDGGDKPGITSTPAIDPQRDGIV